MTLYMRYDEEFCKHALSSLLREQGIAACWREGDDPPDWLLEIAGKRFAVEVTSIHGTTNLDGHQRTWTQLSQELSAFGHEVCREVQERVQVRGRFMAGFPPISKLKRYRHEIVQNLITYFESRRLATNRMSRDIVFRADGHDITVWSLGAGVSVLVPLPLLAGRWIVRLEDQLTDQLVGVVRKKTEKLKDIKEPKILVILDQYGLQSSLEAWQSRLPAEMSNFEAVVRVQGGRAEVVAGFLPFI